MQRISTKPSVLPARRDSFPRINSFFDGGILIAKRSVALLSECEPALLKLFLLLHLILDLVIVSVVLLRK